MTGRGEILDVHASTGRALVLRLLLQLPYLLSASARVSCVRCQGVLNIQSYIRWLAESQLALTALTATLITHLRTFASEYCCPICFRHVPVLCVRCQGVLAVLSGSRLGLVGLQLALTSLTTAISITHLRCACYHCCLFVVGECLCRVCAATAC
jgi:hypothetical protein